MELYSIRGCKWMRLQCPLAALFWAAAVYVVGENSSGQLGQGDLAVRDRFVVIPETRGAGVCYVAAVRHQAAQKACRAWLDRLLGLG